MVHKLRDAEIPWCASCLVLATIACHTCVLVGNIQFSNAMKDLGQSTSGWSSVGLGLSRAFQDELDSLMANISSELVGILEDLTNISGELDGVISVIGNTTDKAVAQGTGLFLLQQGSMQGNISSSVGELTSFLKPMVMKTVNGVVKTVTKKLNGLIHTAWLRMKPVLLQIGAWLSTFGNAVSSGMETFSTSMDKVQKIFDQIMSALSKSSSKNIMLEETFGLFDVSGDGTVSIEDLRNVAKLYSINALTGSKPEELVKKYDSNNDGEIDKAELELLVEDKTIPKCMSTVLRAYARKLTEVAGQLARQTMRDQVALVTVKYFQLVCAKNATKVQWVSDTLGNGTLVLDFTSAVYAQLCLLDGAPEALTLKSIGQTVITTMYAMHRQHTIEAYNNMVNSTYWTTNGFNALDHPKCIRMVGDWMRTAQKNVLSGNFTILLQADAELERSIQANSLNADHNLRMHVQKKEHERADREAALFASKTSQLLLLHLTGGASASSSTSSSNPLAQQAIAAGQPAAPSTRLFAAWLSANATATADRLQAESFSYASTSSTKLDTFATQIQGMIKKATSFTNMMMEFSTSAGIDTLEKMFFGFIASTETDLLHILNSKLSEIIDQVAPMLGSALDSAIVNVADKMGDMISGLIGKPLNSAITAPLDKLLDGVLGNSSLGDTFSNTIANKISGTISTKTSDMVADKIQTALDKLVNTALKTLTSKVNSSSSSFSFSGAQMDAHLALIEAKQSQASLLEVGFESGRYGAVEELDLGISNNWQALLGQIGSLTNIVPAATSTLKAAREEIMKAAANIDSIFNSFKAKGPPIFDLVAKLWTLIWVLYFAFFTPLMLFNLYYSFWASGWFGGPRPPPDNDGAEPPRGWCDRFRICCSTCSVCMTHFHDTQCCFWSMVILMQVLVLVLFVISIVLCIVAGVKAFLIAGCAQVYLLGDPASCAETIKVLRQFTATFHVQKLFEFIPSVCPTNNLLACQLITSKLKSSMILTTVFSFLATILSLQVIIESAIMHEQARYRRMFTKAVMDEEEEEKRADYKM